MPHHNQRRVKKDPNAVLDYQWDWTDWLNGDVISNVAFAIDPAGTLTEDTTSSTQTTATIWLSGGDLGDRHDVTCHVVTADGREDDWTVRFIIASR